MKRSSALQKIYYANFFQKSHQGSKPVGLCSSPLYDYSETFIISFILCLIVMLGLIHFLMCMVANLTRLREHHSKSKVVPLEEGGDRPGFANVFVMSKVSVTDSGKVKYR